LQLLQRSNLFAREVDEGAVFNLIDLMIAPADLWPLLKSIAFELRPFPMPSKADVADSARSLAKNASALATAVFSAAKFVAESLVNAFTVPRALKLGGWLGCWAFFAYLEFGAVFLITSGIGLMFANLGKPHMRAGNIDGIQLCFKHALSLAYVARLCTGS
jgi:Uncharacterized conserved domain (SAYSvFN)